MENKPDRYVSFEGIDCARNARNVLEITLQILENETYRNKFWDLFLEKYNRALQSKTVDDDILYLVCSNVYYLEELYEQAESEQAQSVLHLCEVECC